METKIAILERKSIEKGFPLDKDVLIYIANNVQNNIRELEGALNKVVVIHQLSNSVPTLKSVRNALSDYVSSLQAKSLTAKEIIEAVSRFYEISLKEIAGNSRRKELVGPRQVAVYLIREELNSSYPSIGQEMGGRDHTTAMHAYNKILKEVKENDNEKLKQDLESIKQLYANPLY
jgi:chromosomal replication initiator protein